MSRILSGFETINLPAEIIDVAKDYRKIIIVSKDVKEDMDIAASLLAALNSALSVMLVSEAGDAMDKSVIADNEQWAVLADGRVNAAQRIAGLMATILGSAPLVIQVVKGDFADYLKWGAVTVLKGEPETATIFYLSVEGPDFIKMRHEKAEWLIRLPNKDTFTDESKELAVSVIDPAKYQLPADASAMLSALCSRSKEGPVSNLRTVVRRGADKFMKDIYVGYGHSSIGKCGSSKVFISGVSMIAINTLQNVNPLYKGQESSTRYIPFSGENIVVPEEILFHADTTALEIYNTITQGLMDLYDLGHELTVSHLLDTLKKPEDVSDSDWNKTVRARAFDICRSLLPAGCKTVGVWDGTLEELRDNVNLLNNTGNPEVVKMAQGIAKALKAEYPTSFGEDFPIVSTWLRKMSGIRPRTWKHPRLDVFQVNMAAFSTEIAKTAMELTGCFADRKKHERLPDSVGIYGRINYSYYVDFGGYRDLNRHRKGNITRSFMGPKLGFNEWYLSQMPPELFNMVVEMLTKTEKAYEKLYNMQITREALEYMLPMGYNVEVHASYPLDNAVYVAELRSGKTVHPTVRRIAIQMAESLKELFDFPIYADMDADDSLDVRRAKHDIAIKD